jgi:methionyl-tRNA synthetase
MTMGGLKASTSRGNVIWTSDALDRVGADPLRYYLAVTMPETGDTHFSYEELVRRHNDELLAVYGNAGHRVLTFVQRHFGGRVPEPGAPRPGDLGLRDATERALAAAAAAIEAVHLRDGLAAAMGLARATNRYLEAQKPWKAIREDPAGAATTIYVALQALNALKVLFAPYVPFSSQRLHELLGFDGDVARAAWAAHEVPVGQALPPPAPLFTKLEAPAGVV